MAYIYAVFAFLRFAQDKASEQKINQSLIRLEPIRLERSIAEFTAVMLPSRR
jgi:hypothetical protein